MEENENSEETSEDDSIPADSIGELSDSIGSSLTIESDDRLTFTRRSIGFSIIAIHISCFCSRAILELSDDPIVEILSMISWLAYSLFVPGLVILLYHRRGSLAPVDVILIIPLSLMWVQLVGPATQILFVLMGISNPIRWFTTGIISLMLSAAIYYRYSLRSSETFAIDVPSGKIDNSVAIFCFVMLSLSVVGPLIFYKSDNNTASMIALLTCSLASFQVKSSKSARMLVLYTTALSVMLISSLVSSQVSGLDIQVEYYFANSVIEGFSIDIFSFGHYSTVLSTQSIVPLITIWSGIPLNLVLKLIYPMIFAYCSILLFSSYERLFGDDVAFYSTLFTIFSVSFYTSMLDVARQGFAEIFFLSAIFLLCHSDDIRAFRNRVFIVPMLASMTLAHYGINYVIYPMLWLAYLVFILVSPRRESIELQAEERSLEVDPSKDDGGADEIQEVLFTDDILLDEENLFILEELQGRVRDYNPILNLTHLITGTFFVILWHSTSGGGQVISTVSHYAEMIVRTYQDLGFLGSFSRAQPTQSVTAELEPLHELTQLFYMVIMVISIPSIYLQLMKKNKNRNLVNFISLAISSWAFFAVVFIVPNIAVRLDFPRVFHILAMYTAPFSFLTIMSIQEFTKKISFAPVPNNNQKKTFSSILLCLLFLLSSGFAYQLTDEKHRMYTDPDFDWARFSESEVAASEWQMDHAEDEQDGFPCKAADYYRSALSRKYSVRAPAQSDSGIIHSNYVLLTGFNVETHQLFISKTDRDNEFASQGYSNFSEYFQEGSTTRSRIYDSGQANWYFTPICIRDGVVVTAN